MPRYSSNIIFDLDRLHRAVERFSEHDAFAFDVETFGPNRGVAHLAPVSWLSMATEGTCIVVPMGHPNGDRLLSRATRKKNKETGKFDQIPAVWSTPPAQLRPSQVWPVLEPLFFSDRLKIAHNATFDLVTVAKYFDDTPPPPEYSDTIVQQWILDENLKSLSLKEITKSRWGHDYDQEHVGRQVEIHPFSKVARYAYLDAKYTWLHWRLMDRLIEKEGLDSVMALEMEILDVLVKMRLKGARVDSETLENLYTQFSEELVEVEGRVYAAAGQRFNINSNPQKQKILFGPKSDGGFGLKPVKQTDSGNPSVDADSLEVLSVRNPLAKELLEYADVHKMLNTYVLGYMGEEGNPKKPCRIYDGRIHADFVQYGTVTGRFSCREPNLQNIPRPDTDKGKQLRGLFMADEGHKLIVADYGQIELVVLAHYSKAKALVDGFNNGIDAHTMTAAKVFGVDFDEVTKPMRSAAKGINFAVVYGAGPDKVAAMAGTTTEEAKGFLKVHQKEFPEIYRFKEAVLRTARSRRPPHIRTLLGRKRRLPGLNYSDKGARGYAERQAVNSLIQGSAADLIKTAMVRLDKALPEGMDLLLTVHDELVTSAPTARADECSAIVREAMLGEGISKLLTVPMTIDLKVVDKWAEAK